MKEPQFTFTDEMVEAGLTALKDSEGILKDIVVRRVFDEMWKALNGTYYGLARKIIRDAAYDHNVTTDALLGSRITKMLVIARHDAVLRVYGGTEMNVSAIGRLFNKDPTTIRYILKKHDVIK